MNIEIERKFLVRGDAWRENLTPVFFRQGYLQTAPCTIRVRTEDRKGVLTIKGPVQNISRPEFEYEIPYEDAKLLLDTLVRKPLIQKHRFTCVYHGKTWIIDEFFKENKGLIVAEIELAHEDETFDLPPWVKEEVTGDRRYANSNLTEFPFCQWKEKSSPHF